MKDKIYYLLKQTTMPGQYINSEFNSETETIKIKWWKKEVIKVCLCYPDKYVIGMSNLGIEILYKLLNSYDNILCERVFAPERDMENLLRKTNTPLFSLETQHKITDFDILGFSLQHELCYTNIFTVLDLAKIPFKSKDRKNKFPLVIAGGPCSCNPKVLEEYIDFFVLGEAEESFLEIIKIVKNYKKEGFDKEQLLKEIDKLQTVYVPDLSENKKVYPAKVDIKKSFYPVKPTVPLVRVTHLRLNIEVTRGCGYNCNFCQAGYISKPLRYRDKEYVCYLIEEGIKSTGYDEIAFSGFCVTNYPYLIDIIDFVHKKFDKQFVSISLPSLRIEDINEVLIEKMSYPRKSTITLAPETATERLREIINKQISNEEIFNKIGIIYKFGFRRIKLYFMIGLPTETEFDIEMIPQMISKLKKFYPGLNINIGISIFVPKPHTPFQFAKMELYDSLYKKLVFLLKRLKKEINIRSIKDKIYSAFIEALISRGDKNVGRLIESVWYEGGRFDNWDEEFDSSLWIKKIVENKIELEDYLFKEYDTYRKFGWDNIVYLCNKEKLYQQYCKFISKNQKYVNNKEKFMVVNTNLQSKSVVDVSKKHEQIANNLFTVRLRFARKDKIKFISHLDQIEVFKRVFRMSGLPVSYTQGFNPQIKFSFGPPVPVGYESESEYVDIELIKKLKEEEIIQSVTKFLPEGLQLLQVKLYNLPMNKIPSVSYIANLAEYVIYYPDRFNEDRLNLYFNTNEFIIEKETDNNKLLINLHEVIKNINLIQKDTVVVFIRLIPNKTVKPHYAISKIFNIPQENFCKFEILRKNLYIETKQGNIISVI